MKPEDVILVEEEEIISAMRLVFERMKIVIEPSCATVVAAVLKDPRFKDKKVCCIISGGNVDMSVFFDLLNSKVKSWTLQLKNDYLNSNKWCMKEQKEYYLNDYISFIKS